MNVKRILPLLLVLAMLLTCTCMFAEAQFPLTAEPVTFKVLARTGSFYPNQDYGNVGNMKAYEEMTGVHIEWENIDPSVFNNALAASIASDELPDIILKAGLSNAQMFEWGEDEILVDLAPYIDTCMPNFKALLAQYPDIAMAITAPNGAIYGLPQVVLAPQMRVPNKMYINQKALEKVGKEMPKTTGDLYNLLVAIRDSDLNGNGQADEIPLVASVNWLYSYFYGTFGLGTRGTQHHAIVDVDPENGALRIYAQSENYRKFLEYLNKLYSEKLIYQEIFTNGDKNITALATENRIGITCATTLYNIPTETVDAWSGMKWQLAGPDGYNIVSNCRSNLHTTGNFAVTVECKNIELALKWVDYFYSEEGSLFYHAGVKDVNWEAKADGSLGYTEATLATRTSDMTQDNFIAQFAMWPGGRNPAVMLENLWGGEYEAEPASTAFALMDYLPKTIWPIFSWTEEENEVINTVQGDIRSFINTSTAQVIAGEVELTDEWWNSFVKQIDAMGGKKLLDAYQNAVERIYSGGDY
ncbi:MAG: extracellular solute-binding protein [Christensenellaceae bacterium]|nr:extracellular solute-binding protein [Christensenellaceae bacterium]